jgi:hypothetical protein
MKIKSIASNFYTGRCLFRHEKRKPTTKSKIVRAGYEYQHWLEGLGIFLPHSIIEPCPAMYRNANGVRMNFAKWKNQLEARCKAFLAGVKETMQEPVVRFMEQENVGAVLAGGQHVNCCHLSCPVCGQWEIHIRSAFARTGIDEYEGGKGYLGVETRGRTTGRRDALCIGAECEFGHSFNIVFQQSKGLELVQIEVLKKDWDAWEAERSKKTAAATR